MSVLRLLSPTRTGLPRPSGSSSKSARTTDKITLEIHLPTFGSIFMKPPDDPLWPHDRSDGPRDDQLLSGVLEIKVPKDSPRRCKSVRVGVRTKSRLNMGSTRGWEEDTIFERKVEMMGGNADGILLDEGVQRFEFTLILPSTFAPHDWHKNGKVHQELFAEVEGMAEPESSSLFGWRRSPSLSSSKRGSFSGSGSRSPSVSSSPGSASPRLSPMLTAAASLSITRQEEVSFPLVPSYEESQADPFGEGGKGDNDWIMGNHEVVRTIMVMHNPCPNGDFSDLDLRQHGLAQGVGVWDLKIFSDVFSIGGPVHARLTLPALDPKTTVFSWRLSLRQTHTITSPRDDSETAKPISTTQNFDIVTRGIQPPKEVGQPGVGHPAVWRGKEAGGKDEGECIISGTNTMPKDDRGRPTTLPGLITPIKVSHMFVYEVYFSTWGIDSQGQPMTIPGPGGLRFLQVTKSVIIPSCALIPALLDLPIYTQKSCNSKPCAVCGNIPGTTDICTSCPTGLVPHPRHDRKALATKVDGRCPACSHGDTRCVTLAGGDPRSWDLCACGYDAGDIEQRMKLFATEGISADDAAETMRWRNQKRGEERGRSRSRNRDIGAL